MRVHELDDDKFDEQQQRRRELVQKLEADGFDQYDIKNDGTTRFVNSKDQMKQLRWNGDKVTYEVV